MKNAIVVNSVTGNTKMLAQAIKEVLGEEVEYFGPSDDKALSASRIYLGFWTDSGTCDKVTLEFIKKLTNQEIFLFGTAGADGKDNGYFASILDTVSKLLPSTCSLIGSYMCQGKMPQSIKDAYLKMKEKNPNDKSIDTRIENFEKALSHPDSDDLNNLKKLIK